MEVNRDSNVREGSSGGSSRSETFIFAKRVILAVLIVAVAIALWKIAHALLLGIAGVLFGIFLSTLTNWFSRGTGLSYKWSLAVVGILLVGFLVAGGMLIGPSVGNQFSRLQETLPESVEKLRTAIENTTWGQYLPETTRGPQDLIPGSTNMLAQVTGYASTAIDVILKFLLVIFLGFFFAYQPRLYKRGLILLVPRKYRPRAEEVLRALANGLKWWLFSRIIAILFVMVTTGLGLWLLGVPLALVLGILAGILDFVPYIGPIVAAIPGILLAFTVSPLMALYTAILYLVIQQIEGELVTPVVQQKAIYIPPAVTLLALTTFGLLFGILGVLLAMPLAVVTMILIQMLYVEDVLHTDIRVLGEKRNAH